MGDVGRSGGGGSRRGVALDSTVRVGGWVGCTRLRPDLEHDEGGGERAERLDGCDARAGDDRWRFKGGSG